MVWLPLSSLRARLILLVFIAVLPAFAIIVWSSFEQRSQARDHAQENATSLAHVAAGQQGQFVEGTRQLLGLLSGLVAQSTSNEPIDSEACGRALAGIIAQDVRYANMGMIQADGLVVCSAIANSAPVYVNDRSWFQTAVQTKAFAIGDYQVGGITGRPSINFASPVVKASGEVTGVMFAAVDLEWLNSEIAKTRLPEDTTITMLDRDGVVLARAPDPEPWVGRDVSKTSLGTVILAQREGSAQLEGLDDRQRLYAYAPFGTVGGTDAYVAVGVSAATAYAGINGTLERNLALLGGAALTAIAAAWFGGDRFILRGVRVLIAAAGRIRAGDLRTRSGLGGQRGEIGQLAQAFDEMASTLEVREAERRRDEQALAQQAHELTARGQELARSNAELSAQSRDLARSNADLEQFAYVASHDLQEPLRMVANYTQLLGRRYKGKLDPDADEFISYAVEGATRMQKLIEDLLAFSRVGTRGKDLEPVACQDALDRALANLATLIDETGAVVTHDALPTVMGDGGQLAQVFQNLIANAIRFRGDEPPRIHVSAGRAGDEWTLSVRDNGIGIEPQYMDRIFVIFQRLHTREEYPGTGIGLAICKRIVERHGGRIWVESDGAHGATFRFILRAAVVAEGETRERIHELVASG